MRNMQKFAPCENFPLYGIRYTVYQCFIQDFFTGVRNISKNIMVMYDEVYTPIVCSRSVGRSLRAEVYVTVECSYFAYTSRLTVCP